MPRLLALHLVGHRLQREHRLVERAVERALGVREVAAEPMSVSIELDQKTAQLMIVDDGIGIFKKIRREFGLDNERDAVFELSKGKLTTDPGRRTGEGIFFTSRAFDSFSVNSALQSVTHPREGDDWSLDDRNENSASKGTGIFMKIETQSSHTLEDVFDRCRFAERHRIL